MLDGAQVPAMMRIEPEISTASIRLRGNFNPAILTPDWLARPELAMEHVRVAAELKVVHPEIAMLESEWFNLTATKERFQIDTSEAPFVRIADLVAGIFGNVLVHTPIWQMSIVRSVHFSAGTEAVQHQIGRALAPIEPWGWWAEKIDHAAKRSGLVILVMNANVEDPQFEYAVVSTVRPSDKIRPGIGIFMEVDHRYSLPSAEKTIGCQEIMGKLTSTFDASLKQSEQIIDQIMSLKERFQ